MWDVSNLQVGFFRQQPGNGESPEDPQHAAKVISGNGDVIIDYTDRDVVSSSSSKTASHRWQVASGDLMQNSPYFRALLDPNKFSEGRDFMKQKAVQKSHKPAPNGQDANENIILQSALPTVSLPADQFTRRLGVDALELFLRVLSSNSLGNGEERINFEGELKSQPPSLIARLVEIADVFNSPNAVREILKKSGYAFGKGKTPVTKFNPSLLKLNEDRIRQIMFIAHFLDDQVVFQVFSHTLIVVGSKYWLNGVEPPAPDTLRWRYFSNGIEEELYYRRQCVLNTITDLQAYFLRAYGALEELDDPKPTTAPAPVTFTTTIRPRTYQCRFGYGNSSACDAFHLGQMTRFFALRTKTIFFGSTLIDPDFSLDPDEEEDQDDYDANDNANAAAGRPQSGPSSDITALLASLKQCPDYQIDSSHLGCGVRRRFVPSLDCIERFVGDGRGLLGIVLRLWDRKSPLTSSSWANRSLRRARAVDVRFSKINAIHYTTPGPLRSSSQEEDARLFFTAKKRNWES
ncbi:hypothetical protein MW887_009706 [Aspergillus wentii]|nr:hypothetical protein MW887_009706 [Aspergillus wentii]